jgi:hypothetical protein
MAQPFWLSDHQRQKLGNTIRTLSCPHFFSYSLPATHKPPTSSHLPCHVYLRTFAPTLPLEFSYPNQLQLEGYGYRSLEHKGTASKESSWMTTLKILPHSPPQNFSKAIPPAYCLHSTVYSLALFHIYILFWAVVSARAKLYLLHTVPSVSLRSRT